MASRRGLLGALAAVALAACLFLPWYDIKPATGAAFDVTAWSYLHNVRYALVVLALAAIVAALLPVGPIAVAVQFAAGAAATAVCAWKVHDPPGVGITARVFAYAGLALAGLVALGALLDAARAADARRER